MKITMKTAWLTALFACLVLNLRAEEPREAVLGGINHLKEAGNYAWTVTTVRGAVESTPQFFAIPAIHGATAGGVTLLTPKFGGQVEMFIKGDRKAARIGTHWKSPEEFRVEWLRKSYADLHGTPLEPGAAPPPGANGLGQVNPVDWQIIYLGEDPTAVVGGISPQPVVAGRRGRMNTPPPGASLYMSSNAPAAELPDPNTMTIMLLDAVPNPIAQVETIFRESSNLKAVGAGSFTGSLSSEFVRELAETRKQTGDNRQPIIKESTSAVRFWVSQKLLYKYQVTVSATLTVGPTYNPLTVFVDRTATVEFRGAGATRVVVPAGAAKLLD